MLAQAESCHTLAVWWYTQLHRPFYFLTGIWISNEQWIPLRSRCVKSHSAAGDCAQAARRLPEASQRIHQRCTLQQPQLFFFLKHVSASACWKAQTDEGSHRPAMHWGTSNTVWFPVHRCPSVTGEGAWRGTDPGKLTGVICAFSHIVRLELGLELGVPAAPWTAGLCTRGTAQGTP